MSRNDLTCIRCETATAADELGYCAHCHWAVLVEVQESLHDLESYLESWARFADWSE